MAKGFTSDVDSEKKKDYISQIYLKESPNGQGTTYYLKDKEAREKLDIVESLVSSPLIFKGVVSTASEITSLTDYKKGWTYKSNASFLIPPSGLIQQKVEPGDMIICINDNASFNIEDWTILQNNVDIFKGATAGEQGAPGLVPTPKSPDTYLKGDGTWGAIEKVDSSAIDFSKVTLILNCGTSTLGIENLSLDNSIYGA